MNLSLNAAETAAVRVALSRYCDELEKLSKKEGELGVVSPDTDRAHTAATVVLDMVLPQKKLDLTPIEKAAKNLVDSVPEGGSVTFSNVPGSGLEPVTIHGRAK